MMWVRVVEVLFLLGIRGVFRVILVGWVFFLVFIYRVFF